MEIKLINLNEGPYFVENSRSDGAALTNMPASYTENRTAAVESFQAVDPDGGDIVWSLWGTDAADFTIDDGTLRFSSPPDYESPSDREFDDDGNGEIINTGQEDAEGKGNNSYRLMVRATEADAVGGGPDKYTELDVTVTVVNEDEPGMVELNWLQPQVGTPIWATLTDDDAALGDITWTWYRSEVAIPNLMPDPMDTDAIDDEWVSLGAGDSVTVTDIVNTQAYTPVEADIGRSLLVRAEYNYTPDPAITGTSTTTAAVGARKQKKKR